MDVILESKYSPANNTNFKEFFYIIYKSQGTNNGILATTEFHDTVNHIDTGFTFVDTVPYSQVRSL